MDHIISEHKVPVEDVWLMRKMVGVACWNDL